jgi:hypothetical protein
MAAREPIPELGQMIRAVRGQSVILDSDLAQLDGVPTKIFNQAIQRNRDRFPESFMFQLKRQELTNLRSQFVTSRGHGGRRSLPHVFTEHGALMAATILNSDQAIKMSVALIEALVRLLQEMGATQQLARRLAEIENAAIQHDDALRHLFDVIKPLLQPPPDPPRKQIGFHP